MKRFSEKGKGVLFLLVLLLVLAGCGGGGPEGAGVGGSCAHLSCLPDSGVDDAVREILADAADGGVLDEGESRIGDALLRAAAALQGWGD